MVETHIDERIHADEILSAIEVARELRCSKAHVYNVILGRVEGVTPLPVIVMGRRRLVRRSSLERWKRYNEQQFATPQAEKPWDVSSPDNLYKER